jgi:hypothetical protein
MPNFPAVTMGTMVVGLDIHAQVVPPAPPVPVPTPFSGPIILWMTPTFPMANVLINSKPACATGSVGYSVHVPVGAPVNPTNAGYWKRYLSNAAMGLVLAGLTTFANMAIAAISALIPKPKFAEDFIKEVTGIDTSDSQKFLETCKASFQSYTQWQTWAKLLMPPIPFPGANGSAAVGSPNVTVNGGPLAFVAPLVATSCSDIPVVPNAATLGFSNVMVGVSMGALIKGIAVSAAQNAVQAGLGKGADKAKDKAKAKMNSKNQAKGKKACGCG